eukprot:4817830-Amphidinium_carterae.1
MSRALGRFKTVPDFILSSSCQCLAFDLCVLFVNDSATLWYYSVYLCGVQYRCVRSLPVLELITKLGNELVKRKCTALEEDVTSRPRTKMPQVRPVQLCKPKLKASA